MTTSPRVVVSGVGMHSAFGDTDATLAGLDAGATALRLLAPPGAAGFPTLAAAPAAPVSPSEFLADRKLQKYMSPATALAVVAAGRALRDARLLGDKEACGGTALFWGAGLIAFDLAEVTEAIAAARDGDGRLDAAKVGEGLARCHPLMPFRMLLNMPLGLVSIAFALGGENFILYPSALQVGVGLATAVRGVMSGRFERAVVGGSAQLVSLMPASTWLRTELAARVPAEAEPDTDAHRGYGAADGAAAVIVESEAAALARGAPSYAVIAPPALAPSPELADPQQAQAHAARTAAWECLKSEPATGDHRAIDFIVSSGNRDAAADRAEMALAARLFPEARRLSCDGQIGYAGAAALPLALGLTALWLGRRRAPSAVLRTGSSAALGTSPSATLGTPLAVSGGTSPATALVATSDPDGAHVAVRLSLPEAR